LSFNPAKVLRILFILKYFYICVTSMGTKKWRIYGKETPFKGATQTFGRASCPKLPPPVDPSLVATIAWFSIRVCGWKRIGVANNGKT